MSKFLKSSQECCARALFSSVDMSLSSFPNLHWPAGYSLHHKQGDTSGSKLHDSYALFLLTTGFIHELSRRLILGNQFPVHPVLGNSKGVKRAGVPTPRPLPRSAPLKLRGLEKLGAGARPHSF